MIAYIGPTIKGVVYKNQIFNYRPKDIINAAGEVSEYSKKLFININDVAVKRGELRRRGSELSVCYQKTLKAIRENI